MRRNALVLALPLMALAASCDEQSTTYVPPSFSVPSLIIPTTAPLPPSSDDLPISGPLPPVIADPAVPDQPDLDAIIGQLPPDSPPAVGPLLGCDALLAAVQSVTGPAGLPGGEATPTKTRCYGTVLSGRAFSYTFEIWAFPAGQLPAELDPGNFAPVDDPRAGADMSWTARTEGGRGVTASRSILFPCGSGRCWLFLDVGAFGGAVGDQLEASLLAIANLLAAGATPPNSAEALRPRPTCEGVAGVVDDVVAAIVPTNLGIGRAHVSGEAGEAENGEVVGCDGFVTAMPSYPFRDPNPSQIRESYMVFVMPADSPLVGQLRGSYLWDADADTATSRDAPALGAGVTSDAGSFREDVLWDGSPTEAPSVVMGRTVQFPCGPLVCWTSVSLWAYSTPYVRSLDFLDGEIKLFIAGIDAYVSALPLT